MKRISTRTTACVPILLALAACATDKQALLPASTTMVDIWNQQTGGQANSRSATRQLLDARSMLRRPATADDHVDNAAYSRTSQNEIRSQFHRLPSPDLVMYVFPHLAGSEPVPVPGYATIFPFFQRVQYALPGERTEDY